MSNGMQEELKKNFVLLSKIAKEKKYAQEYLGLLARRGDIGSIRIGKRWYTTLEWFKEFLENSEKKKNESVSEMQAASLEKIEPAVALHPKKEEIKITLTPAVPKREEISVVPELVKVAVAEPANEKVSIETAAVFPEIRISSFQNQNVVPSPNGSEINVVQVREIKSVAQKTNIPVWKNPAGQVLPRNTVGDVRKNIRPIEIRKTRETSFTRGSSVEEKNRYAIPYPEIKFEKKPGISSPNFSVEEKSSLSLFPRFAFAAGFAIMLLLVAASGYFIFSGDLLKKGTVAGASDERNSSFSSIKSGSDYYLTSAGDKIKESVSISRLVVEAAKEKTANNESPSSAGRQ